MKDCLKPSLVLLMFFGAQAFLLQFDIGYIHKIVHYGIYGQPCGGVNLKFGCNVPAMCGNGVDGQEQLVGNLLV